MAGPREVVERRSIDRVGTCDVRLRRVAHRARRRRRCAPRRTRACPSRRARRGHRMAARPFGSSTALLANRRLTSLFALRARSKPLDAHEPVVVVIDATSVDDGSVSSVVDLAHGDLGAVVLVLGEQPSVTWRRQSAMRPFDSNHLASSSTPSRSTKRSSIRRPIVHPAGRPRARRVGRRCLGRRRRGPTATRAGRPSRHRPSARAGCWRGRTRKR